MASQNANSRQYSKGPGCGCLSLLAIIVVITIASYFAIAATLRTMATETKEAYQAVRSADIGGTVSGYHDTQDERELFVDPSQRHRDLKELMVQLTNERRASAGIPP